ncbi:MAG: HAD family phosphatase [Spirochaetaceae bacterium]|jgi:putative hydrolase of the HAD superfamily|nr:HAD family phosphatase [Spirochaetaceae bacterium]
MNIKAVVFDYGKVICLPPPTENREALLALTGLPVARLEELEQKHRSEYDRGTYDGRTYYKTLLEDGGIFLEDSVLEKLARLDSEGWKQIDPGTVTLMRDIKKLGLPIGILSNMPREFLTWARVHIPILGETGVAVFSCDVNAVKPEPRIYEILRDRLGCEFGEIVFFDDVPVNAARAAELGIRAFIWKNSAEAREVLRQTGGVLAGL